MLQGASAHRCVAPPSPPALTPIAHPTTPLCLRRVFLPVMVYYAAQMEGQHVSLSALDRRCANLFFYWDVSAARAGQPPHPALGRWCQEASSTPGCRLQGV